MRAADVVLTALTSAAVAAAVSYGMNHGRLGLTPTEAAPPAQPAPQALVDVPALRNLRAADARALLDPLGLLLTIEQETEDAQVEPGRIRQQTPLEGSRVRRGEAVRVQIARAPTTVPAPTVTGVSSSKAKEVLQQSGLAVGKLQYRDNEDRPDGIVLEQTPAAGQPVAKGQKIDLVVNRWD